MQQRRKLAQVAHQARIDRRFLLVAQIVAEHDEAITALAQVFDDDRQCLGRMNAAPVDVKDQDVAGLGQPLRAAHQ